MTPVGHSLVGLAFAAIALPQVYSKKWLVALPVVFVALASLPDWPLPSWGHERYDISHSIFVNLGLVSIVMLCWRLIPRLHLTVPARCICLGAGAWLSHLLLDTFYNHGIGLAIYWPFSDGRLNLAMPWFSVMDLSQSTLSSHNLSIFAIEFVFYFPIFLLAIGIRNFVYKDESQ